MKEISQVTGLLPPDTYTLLRWHLFAELISMFSWKNKACFFVLRKQRGGNGQRETQNVNGVLL